MARPNPKILFGIHSATLYDRTSFESFGMLEVIKGSSFVLNGELVELNAGSSKYAWAIEESVISAELALKPAEYPSFLFELFLGKKPTENALEATGSVTAFTNRKNASVFDSATGIASVAPKAGSETDMKFTKYVVKAVTTTTVDVYAYSNIDFANGTDKQLLDGTGKITAAPLLITTAGVAIEVPGFGIELIGGSAVIGMTVGDTATFSVRPPNAGSTDVVIGNLTNVFPSFGAIVMSQRRGNNEMMELDIFNLKAVGMPFNLEEKAFSEMEITAKASYDAAEGGVFAFRHTKQD